MSAYCHESNPSATAGCTRMAGHFGDHQAISGETWEAAAPCRHENAQTFTGMSAGSRVTECPDCEARW